MRDRALVASDAFVAFYREHAEDVLAYFARRTLDAEVAADLTAETFAAAYAARARFRDHGGGPAPWLFGIARNKLSRYYRSSRVERDARDRIGLPDRGPLSGDDLARIDDLAELAPTREAVRRALTALSDADRRVLQLRIVEARPYTEIASLLGCTEQAARVRVSRGLRRLDGHLA